MLWLTTQLPSANFTIGGVVRALGTCRQLAKHSAAAIAALCDTVGQLGEGQSSSLPRPRKVAQ